MSYWIEQEKDTRLPDWLSAALPATCPHCGSPMVNYYNDDYRCTNRKCSNPKCYTFVAAKADFARSIIGIDGVGYKTCLRDAKYIGATSVFQLLNYWGSKPTVTMEQFLRMHCFEGIDSEWERIVKENSIYTLDELFEKYEGKWRTLIEEHKEELYSNLQYVTLKGKPADLIGSGPKLTYTIMITGTPIGFATKEHFINMVNEACRGLIVTIHQKTKRQSDVDFLIREPGSETKGKVEAAMKGGIPIVTSEQYMLFLAEQIKRMKSRSE